MSPKTWVKVVLCLIIVTTLIQIGGFVSPLWIYLQVNNSTVAVGLYYRIGCEATSGKNCTANGFPVLPFGYNSDATYKQTSWNAIAGLETAAAAFGLILSVLMIIYLLAFGEWRRMGSLNRVMVVVSILAWLPLIAGLIVYIVFYGPVIVKSPEVNSRCFPWSPLMCLGAAILFFIITFLIHFRCKNRNYLKNAVPTSADAKIALNPSTRNPLEKRYFTPSPYREDRRQALYTNGSYSDQSYLLGNGFTAGAIEQSSGVENRGFSNLYTRAIEYHSDGSVNGGATQVIHTNSLPAGTFVGSTRTVANGGYQGTLVNGGQQGALVNGGYQGMVTQVPTVNGSYQRTVVNSSYQGTMPDRDLSSTVKNNNLGTYGTEVVKRTLVTRSTGENTYGTSVDQKRSNVYVPEQREVTNQSTRTFLQATSSQVPDEYISQRERVFGNSTTLDRSRVYEAFSDMDAETIYYTGKEGFRPITLGRESFNISNVQTGASNGSTNSAYYVKQSLQPVKEVEEVTIERGVGKLAGQSSQYQTTGVQRLAGSQATGQSVLIPGQLSGRQFNYNSTYIYRPYTETSY